MTFLDNTKPSESLTKFFENLEIFFSNKKLVIVVYGMCADFDLLNNNLEEAKKIAKKFQFTLDSVNIHRIELRRI